MANGTGTLQGRSTNGIDDKYDADTLIFYIMYIIMYIMFIFIL